ncbi:hypothetical protein PENANT_c007G06435 [Penicillium antarcticum]|uniref:Uncharacterized protein n=1 Tax=Penicillium antarcticum TaxID=416450 RepID=A0A1V6QCW3_9EURO|nr:uncharacterized protein N7508_003573 [Penicillium antarcticum]KAJ5312743.1 hypothetical protein N7508_003573 [Penicillium antarcticum]OQD86706.1 hypothetical protein PENANT_c007G06435 [Penicillium antarcticum]
MPVRYNLRSAPHFSPSFPTALVNPTRKTRSSSDVRRIPPSSPISTYLSLVRRPGSSSFSSLALAKPAIGARFLGLPRRIPPLSLSAPLIVPSVLSPAVSPILSVLPLVQVSSSPTSLANHSIVARSSGSARRVSPAPSTSRIVKSVRWAPQEDWPRPVSPPRLRSILKSRPAVTVQPQSSFDSIISLGRTIRSFFTARPDDTLFSGKSRKTVSWRHSLVEAKTIENRNALKHTDSLICPRTYRKVEPIKKFRFNATLYSFSRTQANRPPSVNTHSTANAASKVITSSTRNMHPIRRIPSNLLDSALFWSITTNLQPKVIHNPDSATSLMSQAGSSVTGLLNVLRIQAINMFGL